MLPLKTTVTLQLDNPNISISDRKANSNITLDTAPFVQDSRTLVPVQGLFESLGCKVDWYPDQEYQVVVSRPGQQVKLKIGSTSARYEDSFAGAGNSDRTLDVPAQIFNSRTFISLRFVTECFNDTTITWLPDIRQVVATAYVPQKLN